MVFKPILMILQLKTSIFKGFYHCESSKFSPAALKNTEKNIRKKNTGKNKPLKKKTLEKHKSTKIHCENSCSSGGLLPPEEKMLMVFKPILMILQLKTSIFKGFYHCESSKFSPAALKKNTRIFRVVRVVDLSWV